MYVTYSQTFHPYGAMQLWYTIATNILPLQGKAADW